MRRATRGERVVWVAALVVLLGALSMAAPSRAGEVSRCEQAAEAAQKARTLHPSQSKSAWEAQFIQLSRYLWYRAQGNETRFRRWYRKACENRQAPKHFRVKDGEIHTEREV